MKPGFISVTPKGGREDEAVLVNPIHVKYIRMDRDGMSAWVEFIDGTSLHIEVSDGGPLRHQQVDTFTDGWVSE